MPYNSGIWRHREKEKTMNCYIHPEREATGTCVACGKFICPQCTTAVLNRNYCPNCAARGVVYQTSPSTNALAIVSLIFGIIGLPLAICYGFGIIFSITAVITGLIGRHQIKQSGGRQTGEGLALTGLILGLIVTALIVIGVACYLLFLLYVILSEPVYSSSYSTLSTAIPSVLTWL
jgi:hypothetical protein